MNKCQPSWGLLSDDERALQEQDQTPLSPHPQAKAAPQSTQVSNHFWKGHSTYPGIEAEYPHPSGATSNTHMGTHARTRTQHFKRPGCQVQ